MASYLTTDALSRAGATAKDIASISWDLTGAKVLRGVLDRLGENPKIPDAKKEQITISLIKKYKDDPKIIDKLNADLEKNPDLAKKLEQDIISNPDTFINKVLPEYKGGNLAEVAAKMSLPSGLPPIVATPPPLAKPAVDPARVAAAASQVGRSPVSPSSTRTNTPTGTIASKTSAPTGTGESVVPSSSQPDIDEQRRTKELGDSLKDTNQMMKMFFEKFADASNEDIIKRIDKDVTMGIVGGIAREAGSKFGVEKPAADAFAQKIKTNPQLAKQIEDNFKRNPDFVRELALASKSQGQPPAALKEAGKKIMTEVMANPEKLADDGYVKDLSKKMKMGREAEENGMGAAFSGLFDKLKSGDFKGFFSQIGDMIMGLINRFTGGGGGVSMSNNGSFMNNMSNFFAGLGFGNNMNGIGRLNPSDMTAYPPGGQKFAEKVTKNPDGTEKKEMVANTVQVPTTVVKNNGTTEVKMMALVPAVGEGIIAKQLAGQYGSDGKYQQGLWSVPVVTGYNSKGDNIIKEAQMTTEQFTAYQAMIKEASKNDPRFPNGTGRTLVAEAYTQQDAEAKRTAELQNRPVRIVDKNGQVSQEMAMSDLPGVGAAGLRQPVAGQPTTRQVAQNAPSNEREYNLSANS